MKAALGLVFAGLLLQLNASFAFELQSILSFFTSSPESRIPTFIFDFNHPWIKDNAQYLERLDDPTGALCRLNSTMRIGPHEHQYPADLFKYLEIDNSRYGVSRPGWKNSRARLHEMLACPAALNDVEHFKVGIWISDGKFGIGFPEPSTPPEELPNLFIQALTSMPNLRKLDWTTFGNGNEYFKEAFADAHLTLPSVQELIPAGNSVFLTDACLNTQGLRSGEREYCRWTSDGIDWRGQLINSTRCLDNLTTFGMTGIWETRYLQTLLEARPGLKTVLIGGEIVSTGSRDDTPEVLAGYLDILTGFKDLETLLLPSPANLGLGFDGGPWCGNAYMGPGGEELAREVGRQAREATDKAERMVSEKLPNLKALEFDM